MKKLIVKNIFSFRAIGLGLLCFISFSLRAQIERTKSVNKSFSAKEIVKLDHRYGPLEVRASQDGKIRFEANIVVKAQNEADAQKVLDQFDVAASERGNTLDMLTKFDVSTWNTSNDRTKLKFKNGEKVSNLREVKIDFVLYTTKLNELHLKNKYDEISLSDNLTSNLSVVLYSGRINVGNISGKLDVDLKYSKGDFGDFADAELLLYDCNLNFGNGKAVSLNSKYSELQFKNLASINMLSYDDKIQAGDVTGNITVNDKYSDIAFGHFGAARMDIYDSNINLTDGGDLQLKSKYSTMKARSLGNLHFELSYDDEVIVESVKYLRADSKYTSFKIAAISDGLNIISYDDEVEIGQINGPLKDSNFNGKYTNLTLFLNSETKYRLEANLTYGKLIYPEEDFDTQIYKEQNDRLEFKGKVKGATEESPKIEITSYDGKIVLQ